MTTRLFRLFIALALVGLVASCADKTQSTVEVVQQGVSEEDSARIAQEAIARALDVQQEAEDNSDHDMPAAESLPELSQKKMLSQYCVVDISEQGPCVRDFDHVKSILKNLGFKTWSFDLPPALDTPESGVYYMVLSGERKRGASKTSVEYQMGDEGAQCHITFAGDDEAEWFKDSLRKASYVKKGDTYYHPGNGRSKEYIKTSVKIKLEGNTATVIESHSI